MLRTCSCPEPRWIEVVTSRGAEKSGSERRGPRFRPSPIRTTPLPQSPRRGSATLQPLVVPAEQSRPLDRERRRRELHFELIVQAHLKSLPEGVLGALRTDRDRSCLDEDQVSHRVNPPREPVLDAPLPRPSQQKQTRFQTKAPAIERNPIPVLTGRRPHTSPLPSPLPAVSISEGTIPRSGVLYNRPEVQFSTPPDIENCS